MLILKSRLTAALEKFPSNLEPVHDVGMNTMYWIWQSLTRVHLQKM